MSERARKEYTIAVSKGSGLIPEMRTLLQTWDPAEPLDEFCDRVVSEGVLDKATAQRARDIARRVFANRFLKPDDSAARYAKRLVESHAPSRLISDVFMLYSARTDLLIRDAITDVYWPASNEGRLYLSVDDVIQFVDAAAAAGLIEEPWSTEVTKKVCRGVVKALVEFGLLEEVAGGRREIVPYRPSLKLPVYLAYLLHFEGSSDQGMVDHEDWKLYGYDRERLLRELAGTEYAAWWLLQVGGGVVRMNWEYDSMEEVLDALVG